MFFRFSGSHFFGSVSGWLGAKLITKRDVCLAWGSRGVVRDTLLLGSFLEVGRRPGGQSNPVPPTFPNMEGSALGGERSNSF